MKITLNESNSYSWFGKYFDLKGNKKFVYITKDLTRDAQEASEILEDRIPEPYTKFIFGGTIYTSMAEEGLGATLVETFNKDKVKKRIARVDEFDNSHVMFDYYQMTSDEAEEQARQMSIKQPDKVFYVKYDNIMEPCSDIKWKNGEQISEAFMPVEYDEESGEYFSRPGNEFDGIDPQSNPDINESYYIDDKEVMQKVEELGNDLEAQGFKYVSSKDSRDYYDFYRKIEDGKGIWKAIIYNYGAAEVINVTYEQARGIEPIDSLEELRKDLGKKLLPNSMQESVKPDYQLFYDRHLKLWTMYLIDEEGNQISDTEYTSKRKDALELLKDKNNFRLRESLNEALGRDYSHIPEVKQINYSNNKNGNLLPYLDCNAFKAALEEVGLEAFKIKSARLKGISKADLNDEFGGRGMAPWKWMNDFDSSVPMGQGNEFDIFYKGEFPKVEEKLEVNEEEKLTKNSDAKLNESEDGWVKRFNWADKYYKDDYVISAIPSSNDSNKIAHWHVEKVRPNGSTVSHLGNYSSLEKAKEVVDALPSKQISEDIEVPTLEGPNEGAEYGLSELLNSAIQHELETVNEYNVLALNARAEGFDDLASVIDEINTEENKHIGQLQELLKQVSPNAQAIVAGETEASDDLVQIDNNLE